VTAFQFPGLLTKFHGSTKHLLGKACARRVVGLFPPSAGKGTELRDRFGLFVIHRLTD